MSKLNSIWIIATLLSITLVSAGEISISPSQFTLNAFPGETINTTINLSSDLEYAVNLSYIIYNNQSPISIYLQYPKQLVAPSKNISIGITLANDIQPQTFKIKLLAKAVVPDTEQITIINRGSESGGGIYYRNITKEVQVNNKSLMEEYEKKIADLQNNQTIVLSKPKEKNIDAIWGPLILILLVELIIGYYFYNRQLKKIEEKENAD